jgi:hypothetical protein
MRNKKFVKRNYPKTGEGGVIVKSNARAFGDL